MRLRLLRQSVALVLLLFAASAAPADSLEIVVYPAYGSETGSVIEGRVIEARNLPDGASSDSAWTNFWRSLRRLVNDEEAGAAVRVRVGSSHWAAVTDDEGYFRIAHDGPTGLAGGWHSVTADLEREHVEGLGRLLLVPPENNIGIISDFDDTVIVSQVPDKQQLLSNTLLKNYTQRQPVPGVTEFYESIVARNPRPDAAPVFYLSASPRQLYPAIQAFLDHNRFPRGVVIAKKVTGDSSGDPLVDQVAYKTAKIEEILARLPWASFILVGDDGESDPEIYHDIQTRYPGRVAAVWIRRVHPDAKRLVFSDQGDLARALGGAAR